jgi:hypothetical protein
MCREILQQNLLNRSLRRQIGLRDEIAGGFLPGGNAVLHLAQQASTGASSPLANL